ncbi:hypothetical protein THAOC_15502 [Thalassiosira oceanica]|uniref:Uncharacterized protein n=1 Tax=Thalassiosira oceanica TaxID=159749 RepID=K0T040_THAOC|nr:hypothetical protein THAOC_15502 [Thalassiosira oceanica]|eukprot:EJK63822.1 hypothetical protein THAOC_15502 [Thalassiosira oceanica]
MPDLERQGPASKGSGSGSQTNPQRTRLHAIVHGRGLVMLTALKEATNTQSFTGDLTRAIDDVGHQALEKPVVEAFEEDTGLKVGSGVAENDEEEEDEDQVGGQT